MIVLVSLIVLLRGFPCFHDFSHGASLHPYSFIFTLVIYSTVATRECTSALRTLGCASCFIDVETTFRARQFPYCTSEGGLIVARKILNGPG